MERKLDSDEEFRLQLNEINKLLNKTYEKLLKLETKHEILEPPKEYRDVLLDFDYLTKPTVADAKEWFKRFYSFYKVTS